MVSLLVKVIRDWLRNMLMEYKFRNDKYFWSSCRGSAVRNPASIHEDAGSIPGLAQWVKDPVIAVVVV